MPGDAVVRILHTDVRQEDTIVRNTHTQDPLPDAAADALFGRARRAVLTLLFGRSGQRFYLREVARLTGLAVGSVQRELANFVAAGLVERSTEGAHVYFRANSRSPLYPELVGLATKTAGVVPVLRRTLAGLARKESIDLAFVYGSVATGTHGAASDVDLMVGGRVRLRELVPVLRRAQERLAREINPTLYPQEEFRRRLASGEHFLTRVMATPRIMVVGSDDELAELAR
ncbi:MAG: nucleotidyltransferase domain-containing protein [Gemmatimonadales bacterium]|nr:nucleotidyltransferase domain-containing protein [Gemmatimonadales bacterium]